MEIHAKVEKSGRLWESRAIENSVARQARNNIQDSARELLAALIEATPVGATGGLRKGWVIRGSGLTVEISNSTPYVLEVELGRKPARQPIRPMRAWVEVKLGVSAPKSIGIAAAIVRKKSRVPTPGQFFISKTYLAMVPPLQRKLSTIDFTA